ncbi:peptide ABC transporter substrate-binding protein [Bifidobacterium magnum]|uniref:Oligopeptide ABC transporter, solute-binding protein n=1 Tax=Bifidobacterium magnum TaxID=1692 RepID=A0A087BEM5_9BIFI|nr:ABC transporter substrate-binding protein [Bifidobacterium magnum]KFI69475.1 Oligopeptide ABC transporter, solute-binding protein [Bifidobacterium magnum]
MGKQSKLFSTVVKAVAVVASAAMLTSVAGCGSSAHAGEPHGIISADETEPQYPLVPSNSIETGGTNVVRELFEGLVSYDYQGKQHLEAAESITPNANSTEYIIKVKHGWTFSNGEPVTAKSFVNAWNFAANVHNAQLASSNLATIAGYDALQDEKVSPTATMSGLSAPDDYTIDVKMTQPNSVFAVQLANPAYYPLPSVAYKDIAKFGEHPIGNGPYVLQAWHHNQNIMLKKNPSYKGERKPKNDGINFKIYTSMDSAYADVVGGNLDFLDSVPQAEMFSFKSDPAVKAYSEPGAQFNSFVIPERLEHFGVNKEGDLRRAAISMAINRSLICEKLYDNTRTPATDFTSPAVAEYTKSLPGSEVLDYNVAKAKELWAEANKISPWSGSFKIAYNSDGSNKEWVDAVTNELKNNLGINASGDPYATFADLRTRITNRTIDTAFRSGWTMDYPSAEDYMTPLYTIDAADGKGSNDGDYKNPEFDATLDKALSTTDEAQRKEYFDQAQEILFRDLPAIPLWYSNITAVSMKDIDGVHFDFSNTATYETMYKK